MPTRQRPSPSSRTSSESSNAAVLTEYRGLTVKQITDLRNSLRGNATYAVVKNTLTELAAKDAGVTAFDGQLAGPTAIAFIRVTRSRRPRVCVTSPRQTRSS